MLAVTFNLILHLFGDLISEIILNIIENFCQVFFLFWHFSIKVALQLLVIIKSLFKKDNYIT